MADSVDRVFVHALNTVKKIPKTGASRPPPADRLRLYGLYKQAMEADVDGVMARPLPATTTTTGAPSAARRDGDDFEAAGADELQREKDKWDAWNDQRGLSKTEAKRRYIEALIEIMHRYATTPDARELVAELEFVWNQIKNNSPTTSDDLSPKRNAQAAAAAPRRFAAPVPLGSTADGPMKVLSPMSEDDEAAQHYREAIGDDDDDVDDGDGEYVKKGDKWSRKVERAMVRLSTEVAALREQITTGREWRSRRERSLGAWVAWLLWAVVRHVLLDAVALGLVLLWMRRRKDRRLEDLVRAAVRRAREYVRTVLPAR